METSTDTGTALRERGAVEKKLSAPIRGNKPDDPNTVKETTEGFSEEATPHEQPGKKGGKCIPLREQHLFMASSVNWGPVFPLEEAINSLEMQSLPEHQYKKANLPPDKTRRFSSSKDINSYIHEIVEFQKKNTNKIRILSNLFWGNHPQRKRRGYSEKCCLKGCTKEELRIACLPYIVYKN
nr:PREDICTED: insulin-like peptide INSL6 isoform X2 [Equus przewalskii]XP_014590933.1 insulin-like peptide INSL6 isoform X2 [Equus caballus]